jgi:xylulokinase
MFLGLDLSTQQLKAVIVTDHFTIAHTSSINFDRDLPEYGTKNGAISGPAEGEVSSPVAMWVKALDMLMDKLRMSGVDFGSITAVSGAGQVGN